MLVCIPEGDDNVGDDEIDDDGVETEEVVDGLSRTDRRLMCDGSPLCGVPGIRPSLKEIGSGRDTYIFVSMLFLGTIDMPGAHTYQYQIVKTQSRCI